MAREIETNPENFHRRRSINLDITHRCPLECQRCQRYSSFLAHGLKVPGGDMPLDRFEKILDRFDHINFCGQVSDPVHHPKFIQILEMCRERNKSVSVHHASGGKPESWYPKAWAAMPRARWYWGIDGLPEESHKYRINQDGPKMFRLMIESTKHLETTPIWQYIVFRYNEHHIEQARELVKDVDNLHFLVMNSSRWLGEDDPLKPLDPNASLTISEDWKKWQKMKPEQ